MEILKTTFNGHKINVIFNGRTYLFYNNYCGFVAVVNRLEAQTWEDHKKGEYFAVLVGNRHAVGGSLTGSVITSGVRRFVSRLEGRRCFFEYDETHDLADAFLDLSRGLILR